MKTTTYFSASVAALISVASAHGGHHPHFGHQGAHMARRDTVQVSLAGKIINNCEATVYVKTQKCSRGTSDNPYPEPDQIYPTNGVHSIEPHTTFNLTANEERVMSDMKNVAVWISNSTINNTVNGVTTMDINSNYIYHAEFNVVGSEDPGNTNKLNYDLSHEGQINPFAGVARKLTVDAAINGATPDGKPSDGGNQCLDCAPNDTSCEWPKNPETNDYNPNGCWTLTLC